MFQGDDWGTIPDNGGLHMTIDNFYRRFKELVNSPGPLFDFLVFDLSTIEEFNEEQHQDLEIYIEFRIDYLGGEITYSQFLKKTEGIKQSILKTLDLSDLSLVDKFDPFAEMIAIDPDDPLSAFDDLCIRE